MNFVWVNYSLSTQICNYAISTGICANGCNVLCVHTHMYVYVRILLQYFCIVRTYVYTCIPHICMKHLYKVQSSAAAQHAVFFGTHTRSLRWYTSLNPLASKHSWMSPFEMCSVFPFTATKKRSLVSGVLSTFGVLHNLHDKHSKYACTQKVVNFILE